MRLTRAFVVLFLLIALAAVGAPAGALVRDLKPEQGPRNMIPKPEFGAPAVDTAETRSGQ